MKTGLIPLAVFLTVSGISLAGDGDTPQDQPAEFKITTRRKDDTVEVQAGKGNPGFAAPSRGRLAAAVSPSEGGGHA